ncbi:Conjugal transfer protein TrbC [Rickettsiales bacterium Ac37b]|nr:Conjugal transfer protein TrbC [Rickettsiales bacterium Ac37b]
MYKRISFLILTFLFSLSNRVYAYTGGAGLPWEAPLKTLQESLTGPVAMTVAIMAMCVSGIALVWGEEISGFTRRILMLVLAISVLVSSASIITTLFSVSGALI